MPLTFSLLKQEFSANGFIPITVPTLAFQFTNQTELCEIVRQPGEYGGECSYCVFVVNFKSFVSKRRMSEDICGARHTMSVSQG